ncbi:MAG: metallophosphoesterase [Oscillospiraceae bacterium]
MKILVMSDTHNDFASCLSIIEHNLDKIEVFIHLGDGINDFQQAQFLHSDKIFIALAGNCDWSSDLPTEREIKLEGYRFFLTHGNNYNVKITTGDLLKTAMEKTADICLFGHSHKGFFSVENNIYMINPGSVSRGFPNQNSYCIITLEPSPKVDFYNAQTFEKLSFDAISH